MVVPLCMAVWVALGGMVGPGRESVAILLFSLFLHFLSLSIFFLLMSLTVRGRIGKVGDGGSFDCCWDGVDGIEWTPHYRMKGNLSKGPMARKL